MTIANLESAIKRLETINPFDEFAYENALIAYLTIKNLPILIYELSIGQKICRTRTHFSSDLFQTVTDISIPPYNAVKGFGRCNRPFQSKFYGGETRPTSFMELVENWAEEKSIGETLYVTTGLWVTKRPLNSIIITTPDPKNRTSEFDQEHGKILDNFIGNYKGEFREAMIIFYRFLFNRFRKPAKHDPLTYIITTAYCNLALTKTDGQTNCIFYPSVPFAGQGVNFAINSDFIKEENIELQHVMCNEMAIEQNENNKHSFIENNSWTTSNINVQNNKISW